MMKRCCAQVLPRSELNFQIYAVSTLSSTFFTFDRIAFFFTSSDAFFTLFTCLAIALLAFLMFLLNFSSPSISLKSLKVSFKRLDTVFLTDLRAFFDFDIVFYIIDNKLNNKIIWPMLSFENAGFAPPKSKNNIASFKTFTNLPLYYGSS